MTAHTLYRVAGFGLAISAAFAGAADAIYNLLGPGDHGPAAPFVATAAFIANIVVLMCIPAVGIRLAERAGVLGLIGYALLSIALAVFGVAAYMINAVVVPNLPPDLEQQPPVGLITIWMVTEVLGLLGLIILGLATLRARVFNAWIGWAFILSAGLLALSHAALVSVQLAGAGHVVLFYSGLVALAVSLIRGTSDVGSDLVVGRAPQPAQPTKATA